MTVGRYVNESGFSDHPRGCYPGYVLLWCLRCDMKWRKYTQRTHPVSSDNLIFDPYAFIFRAVSVWYLILMEPVSIEHCIILCTLVMERVARYPLSGQVSYHKISWMLGSPEYFSNRSEIWQAFWQQAYQISEWYDHYNIHSRGFETSRCLVVRRLPR